MQGVRIQMNNDFKQLLRTGLKRISFAIIGIGLGLAAVKLLPFKILIAALVMAGVLVWAKVFFRKPQQQQP